MIRGRHCFCSGWKLHSVVNRLFVIQSTDVTVNWFQLSVLKNNILKTVGTWSRRDGRAVLIRDTRETDWWVVLAAASRCLNRTASFCFVCVDRTADLQFHKNRRQAQYWFTDTPKERWKNDLFSPWELEINFKTASNVFLLIHISKNDFYQMVMFSNTNQEFLIL